MFNSSGIVVIELLTHEHRLLAGIMKRIVHKLVFSVSFLAMVFVSGCGGEQLPSNDMQSDMPNDTVAWPFFEAVLTSEDTVTISQLFEGLAAELTTGKEKDWYRDLDERVDGYIPIDKWLQDHYMQAPNENRTRKEALVQLAESVNWKGEKNTTDGITRVYQEYTVHPTKAEMAAHWGNPVWFTVFTDANGAIVCWNKSE